MSPSEIKNNFDRYIANEKKKSEMDKNLFTITDKALWVESIENRAKEQRRMFAENNEIIAGLLSFLNEHPNNDLSPEQAEAFFQGFMEFYMLDSNGIYVLSQFSEPLLAYYHSVSDYSKVVILYLASYIVKVYYEKLANQRTNYEYCEELFAAIGYKAYFNDLSLEAKRKIFYSYNNLCISALKNHLDMSFYYLQEMFSFYNSDILSEEDRNDPLTSAVMSRVENSWFEVIRNLNLPDCAARRFYEKEVMNRIEPVLKSGVVDEMQDYRLFRAYTVLRGIKHELTPNECVTQLCEYYVKRQKEQLSSSSDKDSIMFYLYCQNYIYEIIKLNNLDMSIIKPYAKTFVYSMLDNWNMIAESFPPQYFDKFVSHIFVKFVRFIDDDNEKEEILRRVVYHSHISTCIHINMVTELACLIGEAILNQKPELFEGVWDLTREQVISQKEEILSYIRGAAYFHDIGKLSIGEVINQQTRKIMDAEFGIIKEHPANGRTIAEHTGILSRYKDVIEGHHKSYDGKSGYPVGFDNTISPVRAIIDLITICDCLDAATDTLGRNYQIGKSSDDVLAEIVQGGGSRYNPYIGNFIMNDGNLRNKLRWLTSDGRRDMLYSIYQEFNQSNTQI